ncbi:hypothetical protein D3C81_1582730 [compost metagenome]
MWNLDPFQMRRDFIGCRPTPGLNRLENVIEWRKQSAILHLNELTRFRFKLMPVFLLYIVELKILLRAVPHIVLLVRSQQTFNVLQRFRNHRYCKMTHY